MVRTDMAPTTIEVRITIEVQDTSQSLKFFTRKTTVVPR